MKATFHDGNVQRAYEALKTSGPRGRELARILAERRTRVVVSHRIAGGLTINFLNTIFLEAPRADATEIDFKAWVSLLAHEAAHIEQGFWLDSVQQEMRAYASQAQVAHELGINLGELRETFGTLDGNDPEHQKIAHAALQRLFARTPAAILYAALPPGQPIGVSAVGAVVRQMIALARAAMWRSGSGD